MVYGHFVHGEITPSQNAPSYNQIFSQSGQFVKHEQSDHKMPLPKYKGSSSGPNTKGFHTDYKKWIHDYYDCVSGLWVSEQDISWTQGSC